MRVVGDYVDGGAILEIRRIKGGRVDVFLDCDRPQALGDGTTVVSAVLPPPKARELLGKLVAETPWLQHALAMQRVDQLLAEGTPEGP